MANNKVLKRRVVVTGLGAITPIGNSVAEFWDGIRKGKVGIGEITKFDTTDYKVKLAAEVKDFVPGDHMDKKAARRMEAFSQYAVAAAREAYEDSGLEIEKEDPFRAGVMIGSGIGSLQVAEQSYEKILTKGPARVNPLMVPLMISNMAAGNVSIQLGFRGKCSNVVTACATGTNCIGDAFRTIQYGDADMMLAGGTEGCVCPLGIAGFTALTALSASTDPLRASIPFDKDRDGFVLGEGAGVVMLEELEHAKARGAKIYAEVDYINAHGTSTHHNDLFETRAIKKAFGEAAKDVVINSTKSMIGHLLGAAGGVEFITCVKSMEDGFIHQTVGTKEADEECDLNYAIGSPVEKEIKAAMSNSLGFGGHNATILIQKYEA